MSHTRIDTYRPPVEVAASRQPQVAPPRTPFGDILSSGRQLLLAGASLTAGVIGGPVLAMAVNAAGSEIARGSMPAASRSTAVGATGAPGARVAGGVLPSQARTLVAGDPTSTAAPAAAVQASGQVDLAGSARAPASVTFRVDPDRLAEMRQAIACQDGWTLGRMKGGGATVKYRLETLDAAVNKAPLFQDCWVCMPSGKVEFDSTKAKAKVAACSNEQDRQQMQQAMEQVSKLAGCIRPMTSSPAVTGPESAAGITAVRSSGSQVGLQPAPGVAPAANPGAITTAEPSSAPGTSAGDTGSDIAAMRAMNLENFHLNSQMMQLQEDIQKENRRFTTLSNVLRARHDTAKAAVGNIRS